MEVNNIEEIWKYISGYDKRYKISNTGKIISFGRIKPIEIKYKNIRGYKNVTLYDGVKKKTIQVHRLVALHFIENHVYLPQVNHKDGNKNNNRKDNLEWISNKGNINHAYSVGLINQVGENNNGTKC